MKKLFLILLVSILVLQMFSSLTFATSKGEEKANVLYTLVQQILNKEPTKRESNVKLLTAIFSKCANSHKNAIIQEACGILSEKLATEKKPVDKVPVSNQKELDTKLQQAMNGSLDLELIKYLVKQGADVNVGKSNQYGSPFLIAIELGNKELVEFFIDYGADINLDGYMGNAKTVLEVWLKVEELTQGKEREEKIEAIFARISDNFIYDRYGFENDTGIWNWITAFQKKTAICEGYSRLFEIMLTLAGIEDVEHISGTAGSSGYGGIGGGHAWNKIGEYYYDVTRDYYKFTKQQLLENDPGRAEESITKGWEGGKNNLSEEFTRYVPDNFQLTLEEAQQEALKLINEERTKVGVALLIFDDALSQAAQVHAEELAQLRGKKESDGKPNLCLSFGKCTWVWDKASKTFYEEMEELLSSESLGTHTRSFISSEYTYLGVGYKGQYHVFTLTRG